MSRTVAPSIQALRAIVAEGQAVRFRWPADKARPLVDAFTAGAIVKVHDAAKPDTAARLADFVGRSPAHFMKVADVCLRALG